MLIKRYIPRAAKKPVRSILNRLETLRYIRAHPDTMIPPLSMNFVGAGDFLKIGEQFLDYFKSLGNLEQHHSVLDVGCGIGRMAVPLTGYLNGRGRYEGFDIVPDGIKWCQKRITPRFPNFRFQLADIRNTHYNPKGRYVAADYEFPYPDRQFDFVFLTSVFTHLLPAAQIRYLAETGRVLKDEGRVLMTFFLLNDSARNGIALGNSAFALCYEGAEAGISYRAESGRNPEETIAYDEDVVISQMHRAGLDLACPVQYGRWCGRSEGLSFQDIIVAKKAV